MQWIMVAIGGAIGALGRYGIVLLFPPADGSFPWATWLANIAGSLLIGIAYVAIVDKGWGSAGIDDEWRLLIMVGCLGALTTFSTFALETLLLWQQQQSLQAILYLLSSVLGCITSAALGLWFAQRLL